MLNLHLLNKILLAIAKFSSLTFTLLSFLIASSTYARADSISALPSEGTDIAQRIDVPNIPPQDIPRPLPPPQPEPTPPEIIPPAEDLLPKPPEQPPAEQPSNPFDTIFVREFEVVGNTVLTEEITKLLKEYTGRNLTFAELFAVRSKITELYVKAGYVTSAAIVPPQTLENGIVKIQIIEGSLEDIEVIGTRRLQPNYVRSRIKVATDTPLNINRLLEGLRVLQLDPLIANISADLQAGTSPGKNLLQVSIIEAKTLSITPSIDNARSPSVGSFRRQVGLNQANLLGFGDKLNLGYTNTDGSNEINVGYTIPLNPRNGTLRFSYGKINSNVIEPAFKKLDIEADSSYYELNYRQPLLQRSREEFAVGLTLSQQQNQTSLGIDNIGGFPLSPGADDNGKTRISAVRFFQDWVKRDERQVIAARSQFSLGVDLFDATINNDAPDSRFFAWRGQAQWTRLLAGDTLLLVRGDVQLADSSLVPFEQFGIGGQQTVRGYRQDALLADNGLLFSTEFRIPILKAKRGGLLQLTPFIDIGTGWNNGESNLSEDTLIGTGLGLLWQQGSLSARIDYGIPLISVDTDKRTLQDNGIYFSIGYSPSF